MPQYADTSCLFTVVKNTSGVRKKFGFLPPHGRDLAPDEEVAVFGDLFNAVGVLGGDRRSSRRHLAALEAAIERGDLTVVKTPSVLLRDTVTGQVKALSLENGTLQAVDPCWTTSTSVDWIP